jgi:hypothetical protein
MIVPSGFRLIKVPPSSAVSRTARPVAPAPTTVARTIFPVDVASPFESDFAEEFDVDFAVVFGRALAVTLTRRRVGFATRLRGVDGADARGIVADGGTVGAVRGGAEFDELWAETGESVAARATTTAMTAEAIERPTDRRTTERGRIDVGVVEGTAVVDMRLSLAENH